MTLEEAIKAINGNQIIYSKSTGEYCFKASAKRLLKTAKATDWEISEYSFENEVME